MLMVSSALGLVVAFALLEPNPFAADLATPIHERFSGPQTQPSYQKHVLPLMSKAGCSGRACHGSFQGQGGFRLSLFGYDFKQDHHALLGGDEPRVNLKSPAQSLILRKPTMQEDHGGEKVIEKDSWQYHILANWIKQGAKDDSESNAEISHLEIQPKELIFSKA